MYVRWWTHVCTWTRTRPILFVQFVRVHKRPYISSQSGSWFISRRSTQKNSPTVTGQSFNPSLETFVIWCQFTTTKSFVSLTPYIFVALRRGCFVKAGWPDWANFRRLAHFYARPFKDFFTHSSGHPAHWSSSSFQRRHGQHFSNPDFLHLSMNSSTGVQL
jgi:hypothetical protein